MLGRTVWVPKTLPTYTQDEFMLESFVIAKKDAKNAGSCARCVWVGFAINGRHCRADKPMCKYLVEFASSDSRFRAHFVTFVVV
jgi:hypothetical protein